MLLLDAKLGQDPLLAERLLPESDERLQLERVRHVGADVSALLALELTDEELDEAIAVVLWALCGCLCFANLLVSLAYPCSARSRGSLELLSHVILVALHHGLISLLIVPVGYAGQVVIRLLSLLQGGVLLLLGEVKA